MSETTITPMLAGHPIFIEHDGDITTITIGKAQGARGVVFDRTEPDWATFVAALLPPGTVAVDAERLARAVELLEAWDDIGGTIDWDAWGHHWDNEINRLNRASEALTKDDIAALRAALRPGDAATGEADQSAS